MLNAPQATACNGGLHLHWMRRIVGSLHGGWGLSSARDGDVVLAENFRGKIQLDGIPTGQAKTAYDSSGEFDLLTVAYDQTGTIAWAEQAITGGVGARFALVTGEKDTVVAGTHFGSATFGTDQAASISLTPLGKKYADAFVAKYRWGGGVSWARAIGGENVDAVLAIAVGEYDHMLLAGMEGTAALLTVLDRDGVPQWERKSAGGPAVAQVAVAEPDGSYFVAGFFSDQLVLSDGHHEVKLTARGRDLFISRWTSGGELIWARVGASGYFDVFPLPRLFGTRGRVLGGTLRNPVYFGDGAQWRPLRIQGPSDGFLAQYDEAGELIWVRRIGGADADTLMDVDSSIKGGCLLAAGTFEGKAQFDEETTLEGGLEGSAYLAGYANEGKVAFVDTLSDLGRFVPSEIAVGEPDVVYIRGRVEHGKVPEAEGKAAPQVTLLARLRRK